MENGHSEAVTTALSAVAKELSVKNDSDCQRYFDEWSTKYDHHMKTAGSGWQRAVVDKFTKHTANMKVNEVLDLGAGNAIMKHGVDCVSLAPDPIGRT